MLRSPRFWEQRELHPVARVLLVLVVGVLVFVAIGFSVSGGSFTRYDLLAIAFYAGLAAFAWHPLTAAFIVMLISGAGVVFTWSGGDLLELAIALSLVAVTCAPWVIITHAALLGALTTYVAFDSTTLTSGGIYGIAGIAVIAFLAGIAFRLVAARESVLIAERNRVASDLEAIAREDQERIADELHDGIAHDLTLILFHARALPRQPDEAARQLSLNTIEDSAEQALRSIQSLLYLMRDSETEGPATRAVRYDSNVMDAVSALGDRLRDAGIPTEVSVSREPLSVPPEVERVLTETALEAVTNIIKHAPKSKSARIAVHDRTEGVELLVTNTDISLTSRPSSSPGGRGLKRARQRLEQRDGQLESERTADGWTLRAIVPASAGSHASPS